MSNVESIPPALKQWLQQNRRLFEGYKSGQQVANQRYVPLENVEQIAYEQNRDVYECFKHIARIVGNLGERELNLVTSGFSRTSATAARTYRIVIYVKTSQ